MESKEIDEITRRISVLVEAVRSDVRIVAEGLSGLTDTVGQLAERIDRLDRRIETDFVETRAMIKLSYTELDRRLTTLESGYSELRERVGRLEKTS